MFHAPTDPKPHQLILVLGDQLTPDITALCAGDPSTDTVLMAEVAEEASYVPHHKKKLAFVFSAMRHFAEELAEAGWRLLYVKLDDPENTGTLIGEVARALADRPADRVLLTEPGEFRLKTALTEWAVQSDVELQVLEDKRFIASHKEFSTWAAGRKQLRMEFFYREMRRKTGLLMQR